MNLDDLVNSGLIPTAAKQSLAPVAARYAVAVSSTIAELIASEGEPLARQFLPSDAELLTLPEERADPIGDNAHSPVEGIVHRHKDRVLFKPVSVCPVYCRFCFRREMLGDATLYHARYVNPSWAPKVTLVSSIGQHLFYVEAGA